MRSARFMAKGLAGFWACCSWFRGQASLQMTTMPCMRSAAVAAAGADVRGVVSGACAGGPGAGGGHGAAAARRVQTAALMMRGPRTGSHPLGAATNRSLQGVILGYWLQRARERSNGWMCEAVRRVYGLLCAQQRVVTQHGHWLRNGDSVGMAETDVAVKTLPRHGHERRRRCCCASLPEATNSSFVGKKLVARGTALNRYASLAPLSRCRRLPGYSYCGLDIMPLFCASHGACSGVHKLFCSCAQETTSKLC